MWLTKKRFQESLTDYNIYYMASEAFKFGIPEKYMPFTSSYINYDSLCLAKMKIKNQLSQEMKLIEETNPYEGLYFYAMDREGNDYFDHWISYRNNSLYHYKEQFDWNKENNRWTSPFYFVFYNGKFNGIFGLPEEFDLISLMSIIDYYYSTPDLDMTVFKAKFKYLITSMGGYVDEI